MHRTLARRRGGKNRSEAESGQGTSLFVELPAMTSPTSDGRGKAPADPMANVIQLRCSLCDHWRGNGGQCPGARECVDLVFEV